jgi:putative radical SAM enzyme (TIGR03279 family)
MGAIVNRVEPGSVAERHGIAYGDEIITINGNSLKDIIDFFYYSAEERLKINLLRGGLLQSVLVQKRKEEPLGLLFKDNLFDGVIRCTNHCIFCYQDQLPPGIDDRYKQRYDDYRQSYFDNYPITLTNLSESDFQRIIDMKLSPLAISVNTTDPDVRVRMMGNPCAGRIIKMLNRLVAHKIQFTASIVVVPDVNDGKVLERTLHDLYGLLPLMNSVCMSPVGLTKFREGREKIRPFDKSDALRLYDLVKEFQVMASKRSKNPVFLLSDEIYLMLGIKPPILSENVGFDVNGSAYWRSEKFRIDFEKHKRLIPKSLEFQRNVLVVTGVLGEQILAPLLKNFENVENLDVKMAVIENNFFGGTINTTGLISGRDVFEGVKKYLETGFSPDVVLIPSESLANNLFLDNISVESIEKELGFVFQVVSSIAANELIEGILGISRKRRLDGSTNYSKRLIKLNTKIYRKMQNI